MDFHIAAIFNRAAVIELDNGDAYETGQEVTVAVIPTDASAKAYNHRSPACPAKAQITMTRKNVITLDGLLPQSDYCVTVTDAEGKEAVHEFRTKPESVLLDIRRFGAVGDGVKDDTAAIQAAVMACPPQGTVRIPAGTWHTAPIFLKSEMTLWLEEGAVLLGETDRAKIPILPGMTRTTDEEGEYNIASWEGNPLDTYAALITALSVHDTDIIGRGVIDGNAPAGDWWTNPKEKRGSWRPKTVFLAYCRDIRMCGVTVQNSPSWTIHPYYSDSLGFYGLRIQNPPDSPNTDGLDPESCKQVEVLGTVISVGDDCMAIKSGKFYMSRVHTRSTEDITVRNCRLERGHGSVTVGSEIACGVQKVRVQQCIFDGTDRGLRIKTRRGRGDTSLLDDICFTDIRMIGVRMPFTVNMFYFCDPDGHTDYVQDREKRPVDEGTPRIGRIEAGRIACTDVEVSFLCAVGLPESPIGDLILRDITATYAAPEKRRPDRPIMMDDFDPVSGKSILATNVKKLTLERVKIDGLPVDAPELENIGETQIQELTIGEG